MPDPDDARRYEALVLPHLDAAYNLARWLTRDGADAEDVVQEAALKAFRLFASYKGGDPRPWFLAVVRNTAWSWLAAHRKAEIISLDAERDGTEQPLVESLVAPDDDPEAALGQLEDQRLMDALIERLPPQFRECLILRELEQLSYKEIAAITQVPVGTVMSRLARARQLLLASGRELRLEGCGRGL